MKGVGSRSAGLPSSASCQTAGLAARPGAILTDWQARGLNSLVVRRGGKNKDEKKKQVGVYRHRSDGPGKETDCKGDKCLCVCMRS